MARNDQNWVIEGGGTYDFAPSARAAVQTSGTFPALSEPRRKPKGKGKR